MKLWEEQLNIFAFNIEMTARRELRSMEGQIELTDERRKLILESLGSIIDQAQNIQALARSTESGNTVLQEIMATINNLGT